MKEIIKVSYDDELGWITSKKIISKLLTYPYTPELFIIYQNEQCQYDLTFLTYLHGEKVKIGDNTILVSETI